MRVRPWDHDNAREVFSKLTEPHVLLNVFEPGGMQAEESLLIPVSSIDRMIEWVESPISDEAEDKDLYGIGVVRTEETFEPFIDPEMVKYVAEHPGDLFMAGMLKRAQETFTPDPEPTSDPWTDPKNNIYLPKDYREALESVGVEKHGIIADPVTGEPDNRNYAETGWEWHPEPRVAKDWLVSDPICFTAEDLERNPDRQQFRALLSAKLQQVGDRLQELWDERYDDAKEERKDDG